MKYVDRRRVSPPRILTGSEAQAYRTSIAAYLSAGSLDYRPPEPPRQIYYDREVREKLHALFEGACAYCETPLTPVSELNIDHYRPISGAVTRMGARPGRSPPDPRRYVWLALDWENLFPACHACLRGKRNFFPVSRKPADGPEDDLAREYPVLLNPCLDHPAEHLALVEGGVLKGRDSRGATTIELLALNRVELVEQRGMLLRQAGLDRRAQLDPMAVRAAVPAMLRPGQPFRGAIAMALLDALPPNHPFQAWRRRELSHDDIGRAIAAIHPDGPQQPMAEARPELIEASEQRYLRQIEIENFKGIRHLVLDFPEAGKKGGKAAGSLAILGDNGIGKTSILQATALAAMGVNRARKDVLKPSDCLSHDAEEGRIVLRFRDTDRTNLIQFDRSSDRFKGNAAFAMTVLGYGAYRLPAHGPTRRIRRGTDARVHSLFDERALVNGPYGIEYDLRRLGPEERLQRGHNVARALNALFDGLADARTGESGEVGIWQQGRIAPMAQLSSGFKSILSLATDVMDVMYKRWGGLESAQALILVDEVDAHLHPAWRLRVIEDLRRAFPLSQMLVTSHDPLVLRGLAAGEVRLLHRGDGGELRALKPAVPSFDGLTIDQMLTSDLFGLRSTYGNEIAAASAEYYALLAKASPSADDELRMAELREQVDLYGVSGRTRRERLLYAVIDRQLAKLEAKRQQPGDAWDTELVDQLLAEFEIAEAAEDGPAFTA